MPYFIYAFSLQDATLPASFFGHFSDTWSLLSRFRGQIVPSIPHTWHAPHLGSYPNMNLLVRHMGSPIEIDEVTETSGVRSRSSDIFMPFWTPIRSLWQLKLLGSSCYIRDAVRQSFDVLWCIEVPLCLWPISMEVDGFICRAGMLCTVFFEPLLLSLITNNGHSPPYIDSRGQVLWRNRREVWAKLTDVPLSLRPSLIQPAIGPPAPIALKAAKVLEHPIVSRLSNTTGTPAQADKRHICQNIYIKW